MTSPPARIVTLYNNFPCTTTLAIAEGTENQHRNVMELVRTYQDDLEEFGGGAFETRPFVTAGGTQKREIAILNKPQSTLLLTYMRNSKIVRAFKKQLVKAFFEMAQALRGGSPAGQQDQPENLARIAQEMKAAVALAKVVGLKGNQVILSANRVVRERTGTDCMAYMGVTHLTSGVQVPEYTPTQIGRFVDTTGSKFNELLAVKGYRRSWRNERNRLCHEPTDKGEPFAVFKDTGKKHNGGAAVLQLFWRKPILKELGVEL